jgi:lactoylglutathione lyase
VVLGASNVWRPRGFRPHKNCDPPRPSRILRAATLSRSPGGPGKLNHLHLTIPNVLEAHRFLEKHFGLKSYHGFEPREAMSFLSDDDGMLLALFRTPKAGETKYPAGFHIGFMQESEEQVNQINQRLRDDGYDAP